MDGTRNQNVNEMSQTQKAKHYFSHIWTVHLNISTLHTHTGHESRKTIRREQNRGTE